ncbi:hypothetical protein [Barnesiella sp. An55]|uniref:hypothetical protein n=1 Tax=Barnesiella sp. An55 TaxID=1965646 RepID=UPI0013022522|nr:hypothetical protein [Barnesiella sp. An55]HIZ26837.1 hypothetical protein [Candidatus Barnesiella merdipullorum]
MRYIYGLWMMELGSLEEPCWCNGSRVCSCAGIWRRIGSRSCDTLRRVGIAEK